jgi:uncharacterized protein
MTSQPGKLLRLYVSEQDQYNGKPLYEAVVARCQELHLAGVTVFRGLEGFGESSELHRHRLFGHDQPIVITVIESPEKAREALPVLQEMMPGGVIAVTDVEVMVFLQGRASTLPSS